MYKHFIVSTKSTLKSRFWIQGFEKHRAQNRKQLPFLFKKWHDENNFSGRLVIFLLFLMYFHCLHFSWTILSIPMALLILFLICWHLNSYLQTWPFPLIPDLSIQWPTGNLLLLQGTRWGGGAMFQTQLLPESVTLIDSNTLVLRKKSPTNSSNRIITREHARNTNSSTLHQTSWIRNLGVDGWSEGQQFVLMSPGEPDACWSLRTIGLNLRFILYSIPSLWLSHSSHKGFSFSSRKDDSGKLKGAWVEGTRLLLETYPVTNEIVPIRASPGAGQWAALWLKQKYSRFHSLESTSISSLFLTVLLISFNILSGIFENST